MATATNSTITDRTLADLSIDKVTPDPGNRPTTIDAKFKASIAEHGVLEPVLVAPHPDVKGGFLLIAGERRWKGAKAAGHKTIPAIIRVGLTEAERIILQVTENSERQDLAPCEEGNQYMRLAELDFTIKTLAKTVGRSQGYVRQRLKLVELPRNAQKEIDQGRWSIEDGIHALALLDHPEQLDQIAAHGRYERHTVERFLRDVEHKAIADALTATATNANVRLVIEEDTHHRLADLGIDPKDHQGEECHAVLIHKPNWGEPKAIPVCTKKARHSTKGVSDVKQPPKANSLNEDEKGSRRETKEAKAARYEAMADILTTRINKADGLALILPAMVQMTSATTAIVALKLLGVEYPKGAYLPTVLCEHANTSETAMFKTAVAVAMAEGDQDFERGWDQNATKRHATWLKSKGWTPTKADKAKLAAKRR